jgi:hypothetical protein
VKAGDDGIPDDLKPAVAEMASTHPTQSYNWADRGRSPPGYVAGMGQAYALALT